MTSIVLRARDQPLPARLDYWLHVLDDALVPVEVRFLEAARPWTKDQLVTGRAGAVQLTEISTSWQPGLPPNEVLRTARHIRRSDPELYKVEIPVSGSLLIDQADRQAQLHPGDLALIDPSRPCHWRLHTGRVLFLMFPRTLLPVRYGEAAQLLGTRIPGDLGASALVSTLARQAVTGLDQYNAAEAARVGSALLDLLAATVAARLDRHDRLPTMTRHRVLLAQIHAFIEERLAGPQLSPTSIACAHHISLRLLHTLFERQHTTLAGHIRQRRLERCRNDLLDPLLRARPVSAIAARWGFTDPAHFNRTFKRAYGAPPGEFRDAGNPDGHSP
ncbi:helix-turn-helix domain-containing protein [Nonomuraea sp. NPDC059007]|uniref:AraC-like ligand-binding domain-containing protein n=1 Tax=Nonomuraea sp. NPDC059007 TaxID=3346692 RepID=UPI0036AB3B80